MNGAANGKHDPFDDEGVLFSDPLLNEKRPSRERWSLHYVNYLFLRHRRIVTFSFGAISAFIILAIHTFSSGVSSSPRAIVQTGWRSAQDAYRGQFPIDGMHDFRKEPGCNFTSLDLHQPFSPLCRDRRSLLEAMSGGGRLGLDLPYVTRGCDMQWFQQDDICEILSRFDNIYFIGDSMLRHTAQAMHVLMRGDLVDGGRATWRDEPDMEQCRCHRVFDDPGCVWMSAINTEDLLVGDFNSIKCPQNKRPASVHWIAVLNYPLSTEVLNAMMSSIKNKENPNGREAFVLDHGVWNDFELEASMSWVEEVEEAFKRDMPAYYHPSTDQRLFPKLFITASAQGEGKPEVFHGVQNNIRLMRFTRQIRPFVMARGYEHLALYNLTVQASSPDGTHASFENNVMKAMMVMNWLNMLDPPYDPKNKQKPLSELDHNLNAPLPQEYSQMEADPQVRPGATDIALDAHATVIPAGGSNIEPIVAGQEAAPPVMAIATTKAWNPPAPTPHVIDDLVKRANIQQNAFMGKQTFGVGAAAKAYRDRRGRHPPPGFDKWVRFAENRSALIVEDFFDQLHDDLAPFWAVPASELRDFSGSWPLILSIRDGKMKRWTDEPPNIANWMEMWYAGFSMLPLDELPDVDLAFNGEDEPKLFVPWDTKQQFVREAEQNKHTDAPTSSQPIHSEFAKREALPNTRPPRGTKTWWEDIDETEPLWPHAADTCPPDSGGRHAPQIADYSFAPQFPQKNIMHMENGYVSNWTIAKSACHNPNIRNLHGSFIAMQSFAGEEGSRPGQKAVIKKMVPLLSGCKIHDVNSEILIPPAMQWPSPVDTGDFTFNFNPAKAVPWDQKRNLMMWRGSASGGINDENNWTRFQRHRFLAMLNGSLVALHERVKDQPTPEHVPGGTPFLPHNFPLPDKDIYPLAVLGRGKSPADLGDWIDSLTDSAFIHLRCWPPVSWFGGNGQDCPYDGRYYTVGPVVPMAEAYRFKYQPDIDGASYSGRYRAILHSNSLPLKATIYDEWHDSRLIPWKHFVPMDVSNIDLFGLMQYFFGYQDEVADHDETAKKIASDGSQWANTVLRTDDMLIYVYLLILEMARLQDDRRLQMGYVADLTPPA